MRTTASTESEMYNASDALLRVDEACFSAQNRAAATAHSRLSLAEQTLFSESSPSGELSVSLQEELLSRESDELLAPSGTVWGDTSDRTCGGVPPMRCIQPSIGESATSGVFAPELRAGVSARSGVIPGKEFPALDSNPLQGRETTSTRGGDDPGSDKVKETKSAKSRAIEALCVLLAPITSYYDALRIAGNFIGGKRAGKPELLEEFRQIDPISRTVATHATGAILITFALENLLFDASIDHKRMLFSLPPSVSNTAILGESAAFLIILTACWFQALMFHAPFVWLKGKGTLRDTFLVSVYSTVCILPARPFMLAVFSDFEHVDQMTVFGSVGLVGAMMETMHEVSAVRVFVAFMLAIALMALGSFVVLFIVGAG